MYTCPNFNQGIINYEYDILIIIKFQRSGNYVNMQKCRSIKNKIDKKFSQPFPYCTSRYIFFPCILKSFMMVCVICSVPSST